MDESCEYCAAGLPCDLHNIFGGESNLTNSGQIRQYTNPPAARRHPANSPQGAHMLDAISGYKTYIVAVALGIITTLKALGYITPEVADTLIGVLASLGLITLRAGVAKLGK